ncbi:MAG: hypothetical protein WAU23_02040 [Ferruginibacter sp.]
MCKKKNIYSGNVNIYHRASILDPSQVTGWYEVNGSNFDVETIIDFDVPNCNGGGIYLGGFHGVLVSRDSGTNFSFFNSGLPAGTEIYAFGNSSYTNTIYAGSDLKGLYRLQVYTNNCNPGVNYWAKVNTGMRDDAFITSIVFSNEGKNIFVGSYYDGVYVSRDYGVTWKEFNEGMFLANPTMKTVYSLAISEKLNKIYVANGDGYVYKRNMK